MCTFRKRIWRSSLGRNFRIVRLHTSACSVRRTTELCDYPTSRSCGVHLVLDGLTRRRVTPPVSCSWSPHGRWCTHRALICGPLAAYSQRWRVASPFPRHFGGRSAFSGFSKVGTPTAKTWPDLNDFQATALHFPTGLGVMRRQSNHGWWRRVAWLLLRTNPEARTRQLRPSPIRISAVQRSLWRHRQSVPRYVSCLLYSDYIDKLQHEQLVRNKLSEKNDSMKLLRAYFSNDNPIVSQRSQT